MGKKEQKSKHCPGYFRCQRSNKIYSPFNFSDAPSFFPQSENSRRPHNNDELASLSVDNQATFYKINKLVSRQTTRLAQPGWHKQVGTTRLAQLEHPCCENQAVTTRLSQPGWHIQAGTTRLTQLKSFLGSTSLQPPEGNNLNANTPNLFSCSIYNGFMQQCRHLFLFHISLIYSLQLIVLAMCFLNIS